MEDEIKAREVEAEEEGEGEVEEGGEAMEVGDEGGGDEVEGGEDDNIKKLLEEVKLYREKVEEIEKSVEALASVGMLKDLERRIEEETANIRDLIASVDNRIDFVEKVLNEKIEGIMEGLKGVKTELGKKIGTEDLEIVGKSLEKVSSKVDVLMEEVGAEESLDVGKIPPNILEIVYQTTIDDVVNAIWTNLGTHDAERAILSALEDIRLKTSGSELFRFDGRRIIAKDVAKSIERKLVSARQIHQTYTELLRKLLEYVPRHKAKNFKAMIKIKSQEYAVDRVTYLLNEIEIIKENLANMNRMIAALSSSFTSRLKLVEETIREETLKRFEEAMKKVAEAEKKIEDMREEFLGHLEDRLSEIVARIQKLEEIAEKAREGVAEAPAEAVGEELAAEEYIGDEELRVLTALEGKEKGAGFVALSKELGWEREYLDGALSKLVSEGFVEMKKRGRARVYFVTDKGLKVLSHKETIEEVGEGVRGEEVGEEEKLVEVSEEVGKGVKKEKKRAISIMPGTIVLGEEEEIEEGKEEGEGGEEVGVIEEEGEDMGGEEVGVVGAEVGMAGVVGEEEVEKEMGEEEEGEEEAGEVREKIAGEEVGEGGEVIEKEGLKDKEAVSAVVSEEEEGMAEELGEVGAELGEAAAKESIAEEEGVLEKTEAKAGLERVLDEVYSVINEKGMSLTKIKSACAKKGIKYSLVLDALNKLIDEGRVEIITHGRRTLYKKKRR